MGLVEKNLKILDYLYKQKEEETVIQDEEVNESNNIDIKKQNNNNQSQSSNQIPPHGEKIDRNSNTKSMNSRKSSDACPGKEKKREINLKGTQLT